MDNNETRIFDYITGRIIEGDESTETKREMINLMHTMKDAYNNIKDKNIFLPYISTSDMNDSVEIGELTSTANQEIYSIPNGLVVKDYLNCDEIYDQAHPTIINDYIENLNKILNEMTGDDDYLELNDHVVDLITDLSVYLNDDIEDYDEFDIYEICDKAEEFIESWNYIKCLLDNLDGGEEVEECRQTISDWNGISYLD